MGLTKHVHFPMRSIENLPVAKTGCARYRDTQIRGLGILAQTMGTRSCCWYRKIGANRKVWLTIGAVAVALLERPTAITSISQNWNLRAQTFRGLVLSSTLWAPSAVFSAD